MIQGSPSQMTDDWDGVCNYIWEENSLVFTVAYSVVERAWLWGQICVVAYSCLPLTLRMTELVFILSPCIMHCCHFNKNSITDASFT